MRTQAFGVAKNLVSHGVSFRVWGQTNLRYNPTPPTYQLYTLGQFHSLLSSLISFLKWGQPYLPRGVLGRKKRGNEWIVLEQGLVP